MDIDIGLKLQNITNRRRNFKGPSIVTIETPDIRMISRKEQKNFKSALHSFMNELCEISVHKGLILKGERVIIPQSMRKEMLELLHNAHQGIEKTKAIAKEIIYRPGMNQDIEKKNK